MTKRKPFYERVVIRDWADMEQYRGPIGRHVEFLRGPIAVDALGFATAEEVLNALRGCLPLENAKAIVELLLDNGLLFDSTIETELGE